MKQAVKKYLLSIPGFQAFCRSLTRKHVRTLMYHRFSAAETDKPGFICKEQLRTQMRYIKRHHPFWAPSDHLDALDNQRKWDSCPVVITVDDGYHDFFEVAYPVFREACVPAMLFVTTGFVDGKLLLWWDRLKMILEKGKGRTVPMDLDGKQIHLDLVTEAASTRTWNILADCCRFILDSEKASLLDKMAKTLEVEHVDTGEPRFCAVTWEEMRTMADSGILFGAHTVTHPILSRLDPDTAQTEIVESRKRMETMGFPVDWFCYPQGGPADYASETSTIVREAGFKGSYIAYQSLHHQEDRLALPRYCISNDPVDFEWCLCGAEYLLLRINQLMGKPETIGEYYWQGSQGMNDAIRLLSAGKTV